MVQHLQVLSFAQEELIRILFGTHHAGTGVRHCHLLRNLIGSWKEASLALTQKRHVHANVELTIVAAQDKVVDGLQPE